MLLWNTVFEETGPLVFITFRQMVARHSSAAESAGFLSCGLRLVGLRKHKTTLTPCRKTCVMTPDFILRQ